MTVENRRRRRSRCRRSVSPDLFGFAPVERRQVVASFDGGTMTSDALLLGATEVRLVERFAACFTDARK